MKKHKQLQQKRKQARSILQYVPLRFVSESLGTDVGWIKETSTVTINTALKKKFKVTHVRDGDTFEGKYLEGPNAGESTVIRMIGMDTPETVKENTPVQFYGPESSDHTKKMLTDKSVYIVNDKSDDPYGRTLAYVFLEDGSLYNADLVAEGYARALAIEPNTQWKDLFSYLEADAKSSRRGLWSSDATTSNTNSELMSFLEKKASEYGYSNGEFQPDQLITEEMLLKFVIIAIYPETKALFLAKSFYDLSQDEQFQQILQYAIKAGLVAKDEIIDGNDPVPLSYAHTIISRALHLNEISKDVNLSDFGVSINLTNAKTNLTMGDAILLVEKAKNIHDPLQEYFSHMAEAVKSSETIENLSSTLSDLALADKLKTFAGNVKSSVSDPELLSKVKSGASDLLSSLQSLINGGWKDLINLTKIKKAVDETNDSLKKAEDALKDAQSINYIP
ncbi:thermonuclease family protein [Paenibacillus oralis]|uniref:thermonuclease family protein n=1 Tax=Paenibacillus oralis TaxID=2490856 RepID=UPI003CCC48DE